MGEQSFAERFLALLADDRPLADFEELRRSVGAGGQGAADRAHVLALRAAGLREQDRRREAELSALFETVADLAALKDVDDVLDAIVRRGRKLLGCDVSYLSLNDPGAGATYMRVTQGIHTEEFRKVRLGFGEGLGGLVAETARPYMTDDYFADERFNHTGTIDSAVRGEEIRAILGVPLLLGRTVIGVLYAANHDGRPFARADVDLLSSFAGHAAVALDNARRIRETQAALADLKETSDLLAQHAEGVQLASVAHARLAGVVLQGGSLQDLALELHQVLQEPVHIVDARGMTLASSDPEAPPAERELALVSLAFERRETHVGDGASITPVFAGGTPLAAVLTTTELAAVPRQILERAATTAALIMVVQRSARDGHRVIVADRDRPAAERLAEEVAGVAWHVDLSDTAALAELNLECDVLVNNAGLQRVAPIHEFAPADFRLILRIMLEAPFLLVRGALPYMYERGWGRIINVSSAHGLRASEFKAAYVSAKHGLEGFSKVTALEGAAHGVTSNCVNPGYVRTPLVEQQIADQAATHGIPEDEVVEKIMLTRSAVKRMCEPDEVAALTAFLMSDDAGMVTGTSHALDGGWTAA